ncbi:MAG: hypothetical protein RML56_04085 [Burkholderiales bacterium]|nr:hypothetical protein [Burkholderiales bacterium]
MRTPLGSSIHYTEQKLREVEGNRVPLPRRRHRVRRDRSGSAGQVNQATLVVRMKPKSERRRSGGMTRQEVIAAVRRDLAQLAGARAFPRPFGLVMGQRSEPLQFVVKGPTLRRWGASRPRCSGRYRPTRRSGAWTPTCSSICRSSSSNPIACAPPPSA